MPPCLLPTSSAKAEYHLVTKLRLARPMLAPRYSVSNSEQKYITLKKNLVSIFSLAVASSFQ